MRNLAAPDDIPASDPVPPLPPGNEKNRPEQIIIPLDTPPRSDPDDGDDVPVIRLPGGSGGQPLRCRKKRCEPGAIAVHT